LTFAGSIEQYKGVVSVDDVQTELILVLMKDALKVNQASDFFIIVSIITTKKYQLVYASRSYSTQKFVRYFRV